MNSYQEGGEILWVSLLSQQEDSKNKLRYRRIQGPQQPGNRFIDGLKYCTASN